MNLDRYRWRKFRCAGDAQTGSGEMEFRGKRLRFELQQVLLRLESTAEARELAGAADYPVAGNDHRYWINPIRRTHRP